MIDVGEASSALSNIRFIDLFAGIGGFRYAMESFGAKCVFSSEIDKAACETYEANHGEYPSGDITLIEAKDIPAHDVICGGFPCQPFSLAGKRMGLEDAKGTLFREIARIAEFHKPKLLFLENVQNFETHDKGKTLTTVKYVLECLGYKVNCRVLNASHFGVPQARKRIFILAIRDDIGRFEVPFPGDFHYDPIPMTPCSLNDILLPDSQTNECVISDAVKVKIDDNIQTEPCLAPIRIGSVGAGRQGERIYHPNGHAVTLSAAGGGIGAKTGMYLINGRVRRLHPRECVRLMGLPEEFISPMKEYIQENSNRYWYGNEEKVIRIGESLCRMFPRESSVRCLDATGILFAGQNKFASCTGNAGGNGAIPILKMDVFSERIQNASSVIGWLEAVPLGFVRDIMTQGRNMEILSIKTNETERGGNGKGKEDWQTVSTSLGDMSLETMAIKDGSESIALLLNIQEGENLTRERLCTILTSIKRIIVPKIRTSSRMQQPISVAMLKCSSASQAFSRMGSLCLRMGDTKGISKTDAYHQAGNGVVVDVLQHILKAIAKSEILS